MERHKGVIAIDFDKTIATTDFPAITGMVESAKYAINQLHEDGWFIIINTCRNRVHEMEARQWLRNNDISFNLINQNHPLLTLAFGYDCRKISADIYVDDKDIHALYEGGINWMDILAKIKYLENVRGFVSMLEECKCYDLV